MVRMQLETRSPQDAVLVAQVIQGDQDSYRLLVQRHSRSLFALAYRVTGNQEDADEVVQETFLRAYRNLSRFEQRSNFGTWLYRIAMNCALDLKDKRRPEVGAMQIAEDPEPGEQQVQIVNEGIAGTTREVDSLVESFGCLYSETVWIDHRLTGE